MGAHLIEEWRQRLIRSHAVGFPADQHLVLRDGLVHCRGTRLLVELRELLLARKIVLVELGGDLESQDGALAVLQVPDGHCGQRVPQAQFELNGASAGRRFSCRR